MSFSSRIDVQQIKGFMPAEEGEFLYKLLLEQENLLPALEVGSYCGKSSIYLGEACNKQGRVLFTVDHHRGSEEQQPGEEYFDQGLYDNELGQLNTLPILQRTIYDAKLQDTIIPIVCSSEVLVENWFTPLGLIFIDGGHSFEQAYRDCKLWSEKLAPGGLFVMHDVYENEEEGGQAPRLAFEKLASKNSWKRLKKFSSIRVLQKQT